MMSLDKSFLRGSYSPVMTPFSHGEVDLENFAELLERQVRQGSHGILVTGTTGEPSSLTCEERAQLVGIKHAATDLDLVTELLTKLGPEFRIFCGLEALSLPMLSIGACGLMNAVGNLAPARVAALYDAVQRGDLPAARRLHFELFE